ncbi:YceD family protein [Jannaschia pohangensis]|uniref:Uncharacterized ACR, COG1399 n=1 Tax=Jannaschia pohangensis TaxID=390807 RepID=A0A1I3SF34_9RHOB|nr:DUF177 domain-containing protein [Jannaschia pohangensis]SFJ56107.1 Uncharacterized ACR, COG1399 [Jannaschia pohangensis]
MKPVLSHPVRLTDLAQRKSTRLRLVPDEGQLEELADRLGVDALRKVRFDVELKPGRGRDWSLTGTLGATFVQPCRVTTEPVTTRVDEPVTRQYLADFAYSEADEAEMPEDDTLEPLPEVLDLGDLMEVELVLAVPPFPRVEGAEDINLTATPPGAEPLTDEAVKPFAGLADLKAKMDKGDS